MSIRFKPTYYETKCATCKWCYANSECRRHAPTMGKDGFGEWPKIINAWSKVCGDWCYCKEREVTYEVVK